MVHTPLFAGMRWPMLKGLWGVRGHPPHAATIWLALAGIQYDRSKGSLTGWVSRVAEKQNPETPGRRQEGQNLRLQANAGHQPPLRSSLMTPQVTVQS